MKFLGPNACEEAIKRGQLQVLRIAHPAWNRTLALRQMAKNADVTVHKEPLESLDRRSEGKRHQGVVGEGGSATFIQMPELLKILSLQGSTGLVLLLDGITDSNNFGAILRSAAAANVSAVIFPERRSAQVNESAVRASAGTVGLVPLVRVVNLGRAIDELKEAGLWVYGMSASGDKSQNYLEETFDTATAIVVGSEGDGLRLKIFERCDKILKIEMPGKTESLNVSATAAIALFRVLAAREKKY
ncbi:MAG: 23S rRNA (guanosine(2251)-2'-O)-methyltransferase RlmB [Holophagaceae bacterium]|nr:23S rRNA (guanosine(2251)-2'-O)-methyltransferase RlmB [Holophagaceae bacterium]